jgi:ubiquinone/menaquinone biosynthesis C-methylase UbiE
MNGRCPFCGETVCDVLFSAPDFDTGSTRFQISRCRTCRLVRTEPALSDEELGRHYSIPYYGSGQAKFSGPAEAITRFFNHLRAKQIWSHLGHGPASASGPAGRVLDIGCGRGNLLMALKDMGCECHGVERNEFPASDTPRGITLHIGDLKDIAFESGSFDAVIIWHVLEHISDPAEMVRESARILKTGGLLAIAVPNFASMQSSLFRRSWFHLDLPRHIYHFTPHTLTAILERSGFAVVSSTTLSAEQNIFGFVQSALNAIAPRAPNRFYSLLKKTAGRASPAAFIGWAALAACALPFAFVEYLVSGIAGKGASLILYSQKKNM